MASTANFYFFTDEELLAVQNPGQEYGPINATEFRVTNLHGAVANATPNAYAVCKGLVFIQEIPNSNPEMVNLVLKPEVQETSINPAVKFFIYRGILKSSLITGNLVDTQTNKLTAEIGVDYIKVQNAGGFPTLEQKILGLDLPAASFTSATPIDNVFYRLADPTFTLRTVEGGWSIGKFNGASFGFEIMLDSLGFEPTLGELTSGIENKVTVPALPGNPTETDRFIEQNNKEAVLNYLDSAAFFGNFSRGGIILGRNQASNPNITTNSNFDDVANVYTEVLRSFQNRSTYYIDIRNELNESFDFQHNYGTINASQYVHAQIKIAFDGSAALLDRDYYDINRWPLLRIKTADFANSPNATPTFEKQVVRVAFQGGDNRLPILYISNGYLDDGNTTNATQFPAVVTDQRKFNPLTIAGQQTSAIAIAIPNNGASSELIAGYCHLKYVKLQQQFQDIGGVFSVTPNITQNTILNGLEPLDHVFTPFKVINGNNNQTTLESNMNISWTAANTQIQSNLFYDKQFVDATRFTGQCSITHRGIGITSNGDRTLFAYVIERSGVSDQFKDTAFGLTSTVRNADNAETFLQTFVKDVNSVTPNKLTWSSATFQFTANNTTSNVSIELLNNVSIPDDFTGPQPTDLLNIKLSDAEWQAIITRATGQGLLSGFKVYLGLRFDTTALCSVTVTQNNSPQPAQQLRCARMEIVLRGYVSGQGNQPQLIEINNLNGGTPIYYYSLTPAIVVDGVPSNGNSHRVYSQVNHRNIETTLLFTRGAMLSPQEYVDYLSYVKESIRKVWTTADPNDPNSTFGNKGLFGLQDGAGNPITIGVDPITGPQNPNVLLSPGIQFLHAKFPNFSQVTGLNDREVLVSLDRDDTTGRDATIGRRRMRLYFDVNDTNTPAHEFGHVLGLADRYAYVGFANIDLTPPNPNSPSSSQDRCRMNPFYGRGCSLYLPDSYDDQYTTNFRWFHNLMTFGPNYTPAQNGFPINTVGPPRLPAMLGEADYRTQFDNAQYWADNPIPNTTPQRYGRITIFVTQVQWNVVNAVATPEELIAPQYFRYVRHVFFLHYANSFQYPPNENVYFNGSFAGRKTIEPGLTVSGLVTDDGYSTYGGSNHLQVNGSMNMRFRDSTIFPSTGFPANFPIASLPAQFEVVPIRADGIKAHVGPFDRFSDEAMQNGVNALQVGTVELFQENHLRMRKYLERGQLPGNDTIEQAIEERRSFIGALLNKIAKTSDPEQFMFTPLDDDANGPKSIMSPLIIHFNTPVYFNEATTIDQVDDFELRGFTGGLLLTTLPGTRRYLNDQQNVVVESIPSTSKDAGYLIWNYVTQSERGSDLTGGIDGEADLSTPPQVGSEAEYYRKYVTNDPKLREENPTIPPSPPAFPTNNHTSRKYTVRWDAFTNRNIIVYLITYGSIDNNNIDFNFFRNHTTYNYNIITGTQWY